MSAIDDRFSGRTAELAGREDQLAADEARLSTVDVRTEPDVRRLQDTYDAKYREFTGAEEGLICERAGTCDTEPGAGPAYRERRDRFDRLEGELRVTQEDLNRAINDARLTMGALNEKQLDLVRADQSQVRAELAVLLRDERHERAVANTEPVASSERLGALFSTWQSVGWPMAAFLLLVFLGMVLLQTIPVWTRLYRGNDPPPRRGPDQHWIADVHSPTNGQVADSATGDRSGLSLGEQ